MNINKTINTILVTLVGALLITLVSTYFKNFVTHAEFDEYRIKDQRFKTEIKTKLEIIIKNLDCVKKKLGVI